MSPFQDLKVSSWKSTDVENIESLREYHRQQKNLDHEPELIFWREFPSVSNTLIFSIGLKIVQKMHCTVGNMDQY